MWRTVKLGDVCTIKTGKKDVNEGNPTGKYPFFTCAKEHTFSNVYSFDCEAILIAGNGAVGQTSYYKGKFEAYQRTYVLSEFHSILPKLLLFILQGRLMPHLSSMVLGNTIPYIKKGMLQNFEFPLPPLAEQQRIVAKLDTAFAEIDSAIEQVEAKQADAKRLKASLLGISLRGDAVMWKTVKLGDVCELIGGGTPSKKNAAYYGGEIPWATVRDMHSDELSKTELKITQLGLENSSSKVIPANNIVIASRVGLGKVCLLNQSTAINQDLRGVIPKKSDTIDVRFLFYWFKSIEQTIISAGRGATVHGVTLPFLKALELSLPPLAEQQHIVAKLDAAFTEIENISATTSKSKENYSFLKSAILSQELQPSEAA